MHADNSQLQIRSPQHVTTFLRGCGPHGVIKQQKILTLLTEEFEVGTRAIQQLLALPPDQPDPRALGRGNSGAYSVPARRSMLDPAERERLGENDRFLASQWARLLSGPSHRAPWSH